MFDGSMDEVRASNVVRPAGRIATSYENQRDPAGFYTVAPAQ